MKLPTEKECEELLEEYKVPSNVRAHSEKVRKVAVQIGKAFLEAGIKVDLELIDRAAKLHDLLRVVNFENFNKQPEATKEEYNTWTKQRKKYAETHHAEAGYLELKDKYPEIAIVVRKHRYKWIGKQEGPKTWEEKIVNYADKRVTHDKIVSIEERNRDAIKRFHDGDMILEKDRMKNLKELEKEIFSQIKIKPEDIK